MDLYQVLGGATSLWAMPISFYLLMKKSHSKTVCRCQWIFYFGRMFPVTIGYVYTEVFKIEMLLLGFTGSIFALIGFQLGENLREKVNF